MHFVSTIFTTIGYGGVTPVTFGANHIFAVNILVIKIMDTSIICVSGGKFMTILMIVTLIPFFLHCLCTSASNINILIDRFIPCPFVLYSTTPYSIQYTIVVIKNNC